METEPGRAGPVDRIRETLGARCDELSWIMADQAREAMDRRAALLARLGPDCTPSCGGAKLAIGELSPGCRRCVAGTWSCLFVNGKCNADCPYCPTPQPSIGEPETNALRFTRPEVYARYLERFAFDGASLSGGEPLLTVDRTLSFLRAARRRLGPALHLWMYSNGKLVDERVLARLRDVGLDEVRLNIGAVGYDLGAARLAAAAIPCVTVEVPAMPDRADQLWRAMTEMPAAGVRHLNLHQLRLTPHNLPRLARRGYTFVPGDAVTVLESELLILELMTRARDAGLGLPINYCSFAYKDRYQKAAARRRGAAVVARPFEGITRSGHVRRLVSRGTPEAVEALVARLSAADPGRWSRREPGSVSLSAELLAAADADGLELAVAYDSARIVSSVSYRFPFVEVELDRSRSAFVERQPASGEIPIARDQIAALIDLTSGGPAAGAPARVVEFERIPTGLPDYC